MSKLSQGCPKVVSTSFQSCLQVVPRLSQSDPKVVLKLFHSCLQVVFKLSLRDAQMLSCGLVDPNWCPIVVVVVDVVKKDCFDLKRWMALAVDH